jgi:hypothetical protein
MTESAILARFTEEIPLALFWYTPCLLTTETTTVREALHASR